ncbi:hypothetical protein ABT261_36925, partial [Amycolatopsis sp. NPDC000740]
GGVAAALETMARSAVAAAEAGAVPFLPAPVLGWLAERLREIPAEDALLYRRRALPWVAPGAGAGAGVPGLSREQLLELGPAHQVYLDALAFIAYERRDREDAPLAPFARTRIVDAAAVSAVVPPTAQEHRDSAQRALDQLFAAAAANAAATPAAGPTAAVGAARAIPWQYMMRDGKFDLSRVLHQSVRSQTGRQVATVFFSPENTTRQQQQAVGGFAGGLFPAKSYTVAMPRDEETGGFSLWVRAGRDADGGQGHRRIALDARGWAHVVLALKANAARFGEAPNIVALTCLTSDDQLEELRSASSQAGLHALLHAPTSRAATRPDGLQLEGDGSMRAISADGEITASKVRYAWSNYTGPFDAGPGIVFHDNDGSDNDYTSSDGNSQVGPLPAASGTGTAPAVRPGTAAGAPGADPAGPSEGAGAGRPQGKRKGKGKAVAGPSGGTGLPVRGKRPAGEAELPVSPRAVKRGSVRAADAGPSAPAASSSGGGAGEPGQGGSSGARPVVERLDQGRVRTTFPDEGMEMTVHRLRPEPGMDDKFLFCDPDDPDRPYAPYAGPDGKLHPLVRERAGEIKARVAGGRSAVKGIVKADDGRLPNVKDKRIDEWLKAIGRDVAAEVRRTTLGVPAAQARVEVGPLEAKHLREHEGGLEKELGLFLARPAGGGRSRRYGLTNGRILGVYRGSVVRTPQEAARFAARYPGSRSYRMDVSARGGPSYTFRAEGAASSVGFANTVYVRETGKQDWSEINAVWLTCVVDMPDVATGGMRQETVAALVALDSAFDPELNPFGIVWAEYGEDFPMPEAPEHPMVKSEPDEGTELGLLPDASPIAGPDSSDGSDAESENNSLGSLPDAPPMAGPDSGEGSDAEFGNNSESEGEGGRGEPGGAGRAGDSAGRDTGNGTDAGPGQAGPASGRGGKRRKKVSDADVDDWIRTHRGPDGRLPTSAAVAAAQGIRRSRAVERLNEAVEELGAARRRRYKPVPAADVDEWIRTYYRNNEKLPTISKVRETLHIDKNKVGERLDVIAEELGVVRRRRHEPVAIEEVDEWIRTYYRNNRKLPTGREVQDALHMDVGKAGKRLNVLAPELGVARVAPQKAMPVEEAVAWIDAFYRDNGRLPSEREAQPELHMDTRRIRKLLIEAGVRLKVVLPVRGRRPGRKKGVAAGSPGGVAGAVGAVSGSGGSGALPEVLPVAAPGSDDAVSEAGSAIVADEGPRLDKGKGKAVESPEETGASGGALAGPESGDWVGPGSEVESDSEGVSGSDSGSDSEGVSGSDSGSDSEGDSGSDSGGAVAVDTAGRRVLPPDETVRDWIRRNHVPGEPLPSQSAISKATGASRLQARDLRAALADELDTPEEGWRLRMDADREVPDAAIDRWIKDNRTPSGGLPAVAAVTRGVHVSNERAISRLNAVAAELQVRRQQTGGLTYTDPDVDDWIWAYYRRHGKLPSRDHIREQLHTGTARVGRRLTAAKERLKAANESGLDAVPGGGSEAVRTGGVGGSGRGAGSSAAGSAGLGSSAAGVGSAVESWEGLVRGDGVLDVSGLLRVDVVDGAGAVRGALFPRPGEAAAARAAVAGFAAGRPLPGWVFSMGMHQSTEGGVSRFSSWRLDASARGGFREVRWDGQGWWRLQEAVRAEAGSVGVSWLVAATCSVSSGGVLEELQEAADGAGGAIRVAGPDALVASEAGEWLVEEGGSLREDRK